MSSESWLSRNWIYLTMPLILIGGISFLLGSTYFIAQDNHQKMQKILDDENNQYMKVKGDCKALGQWILDQGSNTLNLDPILNKAHDYYMVNCR